MNEVITILRSEAIERIAKYMHNEDMVNEGYVNEEEISKLWEDRKKLTHVPYWTSNAEKLVELLEEGKEIS